MGINIKLIENFPIGHKDELPLGGKSVMELLYSWLSYIDNYRFSKVSCITCGNPMSHDGWKPLKSS